MSRFDRLLGVMTKPSVILSYMGLILISFLYLDKPIANFFYTHNLMIHCPWLGWLTQLGLGMAWLPILFMTALFFHFVYVNRACEVKSWFLFACVALSSMVCLPLKILLGRARPILWFNDHLFGFYGFTFNSYFYSFPSGHTTVVMSLVFGLSIVFPRHMYAYILVGIVVALSRVLLIYHYLSDVLAAAYLSLITVGLLLSFLRKKSWLACAWKQTI